MNNNLYTPETNFNYFLACENGDILLLIATTLFKSMSLNHGQNAENRQRKVTFSDSTNKIMKNTFKKNN